MRSCRMGIAGQLGRRWGPGPRMKTSPSIHSVDPLVVRLEGVCEEGNQRQRKPGPPPQNRLVFLSRV